MNKKINRRQFVATTAAAGVAARMFGQGQGPTVIRRGPAKPVVISSANGNKFKNGGDVTCVEKAFTMMTQGSDGLDALIPGVNILEVDPPEENVRYRRAPTCWGPVPWHSARQTRPAKPARSSRPTAR